MTKLLHVGFGFAGRTPGIKAIQEVFGKIGWARYSPNAWVVATDEAPQALANRLRKICSEDDSIYVVELNVKNDGGFLHKEIWDWLREYKK